MAEVNGIEKVSEDRGEPLFPSLWDLKQIDELQTRIIVWKGKPMISFYIGNSLGEPFSVIARSLDKKFKLAEAAKEGQLYVMSINKPEDTCEYLKTKWKITSEAAFYLLFYSLLELMA